MTRMTVNGEAIDYRLDPDDAFAVGAARRVQPHRHQIWLRQPRLRRLHGDRRRPRGAELQRRRSATLEGATVTTIEGLSGDGSHPVQQAWLAEQVTMCGYCEPGFIMAIAALLEASPSPSEEQIAALPNICRCGAYPRIRKAIARAAQSAPSAATGQS